MIVTTTLTNCSNVPVYPTDPQDPPLPPRSTVSVGGAAGDGSVVVTTNPPQVPPIPPVNTGETSKPINTPPGTTIFMHYIAGPGKPQVVEVTLTDAPAGR